MAKTDYLYVPLKLDTSGYEGDATVPMIAAKITLDAKHKGQGLGPDWIAEQVAEAQASKGDLRTDVIAIYSENVPSWDKANFPSEAAYEHYLYGLSVEVHAKQRDYLYSKVGVAGEKRARVKGAKVTKSTVMGKGV